MRGTHPLTYMLNEQQRVHYRAFMDAVHGQDVNDVVRYMDKVTGMRWRGSSKSDMAYYYATAKVHFKHHGGGCTFPQAGRCDIKKLAKEFGK